MNASRLTAATAAVVILAGSAVAVAAGDPTPDPPPRIAFVARGDGTNFADALAVGSVAGQLGAPVFTTSKESLPTPTATALTAYDPELVIITGGTAAVTAEVESDIAATTGLHDDKVVRAAGDDRYATASRIAAIFDDLGIDPAFLPVGATAIDADTVDGMDATDFQPAGDYLAADGSVPLTDDLGYAQPQTRVMYLDHRDFVATSGHHETRTAQVSNFGNGIADTLTHAVHLPPGAVITGMAARTYDGDAAEDLAVTLSVYERHGGGNALVTALQTSGTPATGVMSTNDIHASFAEVNPDVHQYAVNVRPPDGTWTASMDLYWVSITYTVQTVQ